MWFVTSIFCLTCHLYFCHFDCFFASPFAASHGPKSHFSETEALPNLEVLAWKPCHWASGTCTVQTPTSVTLAGVFSAIVLTHICSNHACFVIGARNNPSKWELQGLVALGVTWSGRNKRRIKSWRASFTAVQGIGNICQVLLHAPLSPTHHVGVPSHRHGDQNRSSPLNAPFRTGIAHIYSWGLFPPPERKCVVTQFISKIIQSLTYLHGKKVLAAFSFKGF